MTFAAPAVSAAPPKIKLTVQVNLGIGTWERWSLNCLPTSGTHPNRAKACALLSSKNGKSVLLPIPKDKACSMIFGGPEMAKVDGISNKRSVHIKFNQSNGCEIAKWKAAIALFTVPGTSVVRGQVALAPTCAVQVQGAICEDPSVSAPVTFNQGTKQISTQAVAQKGFAVRLASGTWTVTAQAGRSCQSTEITVPTSTPFTISCDTGLR
jgi:hypothetical protein